MYKLSGTGDKPAIQLLGAGTILREVIAAAEMLQKEFNISADVFTDRHNRLSAETTRKASYLEQQLHKDSPVIVATDYVRALPQQIAPFISSPVTILGTDGYGRSANRPALRRFFEVDKEHIALAAIDALIQQGTVEAQVKADAIKNFGIDPTSPAPWTV